MTNETLIIKLLESHKIDTDKRLDRIDDKLEDYNDQLSIHIQGVQTNMERLQIEKEARIEKNKAHESRIFIVEQSNKLHKEKIEDIGRRAITPKRVMKWIASIGAISGSIYAVLRVINFK